MRTCTQKIAKPNPIFCKDRESREKNGNLGPVFRTASYLRLCQRWGKVSDKPNLISISSPCAAKSTRAFRIRSDRRSVEPARAASCKTTVFRKVRKTGPPCLKFRSARSASSPIRAATDSGTPGPDICPDRETESEINFVHLSSIRTYARKTRKTDRHIRHQYDRRTIPELPADTLFHPGVRPGHLRDHRGRICPDSIRSRDPDDGNGVGILPFCSQSRRSGRRRDGRQTAIVRYHMGHHFPGSPAFFRAGNPLPHDGFRVDGSGLRRKPRLRSMGRGDHFPRRLHGDSLCTPAGTGTGPDLCRVQGLQRRNYGSFGSGLRSCRLLRNIRSA